MRSNAILLAATVLPLIVGCVPARNDELGAAQSASSPPPMVITNVQFDIEVRDLEEARRQLGFVEQLGGRIVDVRQESVDGEVRLTADLQTPSESIGRVVDVLNSEFGEVTYFNAWSADISLRYARLLRELAELEASLPGLSNAALVQAQARVDHLRGMIAFREQREAYDSVVVRLTEAR